MGLAIILCFVGHAIIWFVMGRMSMGRRVGEALLAHLETEKKEIEALGKMDRNTEEFADYYAKWRLGETWRLANRVMVAIKPPFEHFFGKLHRRVCRNKKCTCKQEAVQKA